MLFKDYKTIFKKELSFLYDEEEIDSFFYLILEKLHGLRRLDLALNHQFAIAHEDMKQWENIVSELKTHKPIQYILGETEFMGLPFFVNENVLIPRPETEELVQKIIDNNRNKKNLKILDIGTGSGCIPISLKKNLPDAKVYAIDVSEKALEVAQKNAEINETHIHFVLQNILEVDSLSAVEGLPESFDIIVSNPPYVRYLEKEEMKPNVLEYEPHLALFVENDDALLFYRKIAELAKKSLKQNGQLYFEINQYLGKETVLLLDGLGFKEIRLIKDIYGNERMISCLI